MSYNNLRTSFETLLIKNFSQDIISQKKEQLYVTLDGGEYRNRTDDLLLARYENQIFKKAICL